MSGTLTPNPSPRFGARGVSKRMDDGGRASNTQSGAAA